MQNTNCKKRPETVRFSPEEITVIRIEGRVVNYYNSIGDLVAFEDFSEFLGQGPLSIKD